MPITPAAPLRLSDTQREVLSAASQRPDGALILPARLKGKAAQALVQALLDKRLAREIRAKGDLPISRVDAETKRAFALILTKAGRDLVAARAPLSSPTAAAPAVSAAASSPNGPRDGSKLAAVVAMLGRQHGTSVDELMTAMGWLPHTTRAVLAGLRKRGYALTRESADSGSRYRISAPSAAV